MVSNLITQEVLAGIEPISNFPSEQFRALVSEIDHKLLASLSIEEDIGAFLASSNWLSEALADREKLAEAMLVIHYLRLLPLSNEKLVEEIARAWAHWGEKADSTETLISNVRTLLQSGVLRASVKALSLIGDHDKLFLNSRILTDIRPVFDDDVSKSTLACLIVHTLKLSIHADGHPQDIFVAMDTQELQQLRDTIDRALDKGKSLANVIRSNLGGRMGPLIDHTVDDKESKND